MDPFQQEILELIASHDGQYSWYQLDRALSQFSPNAKQNAPLLRGLMPILRGLEHEGLILAWAGPLPSQPFYSITDQGKLALDRALKGHEVG